MKTQKTQAVESATESVGVTETQEQEFKDNPSEWARKYLADCKKESAERKARESEDMFGKVIFQYTDGEAVEDGILVENPRSEVFGECSIITANLLNRIEKLAEDRNKSRVFEIDTNHLLGCLMVGAKEIYEGNKFKGDNDKDFFVMPKTEEGLVIWFVRNGSGKLTAMLPGDY